MLLDFVLGMKPKSYVAIVETYTAFDFVTIACEAKMCPISLL